MSTRLTVALIIAAPFHVVLCVLNDLADIELDRGDPRKAGRPLVSGAVSPKTATIVVVVAAILPFVLDPVSLGLSGRRWFVLLVAFIATAVYNVKGKRARIPPLMDLSQGIGAGAFVLYSAMVVSGPTWITWGACISVVLFIVLLNGAHAGLRDLTSDYAFGARTTPIFFGARPGDNGPTIPGRFSIYIWLLEGTFIVTASLWIALALMRSTSYWSSAIAMGIFVIGSLGSLYLALDSSRSMERRYLAAGVQMLCGVGCITTVATIRFGGIVSVGILAVVLIPLAVKRIARAIRVIWRAGHAEAQEDSVRSRI
jgi:4-hydroxybenzoate polyprenyltransferase